MVKSSIKSLVAHFGFEIRRRGSRPAAAPAPLIRTGARSSFAEALEQARRNGLAPGTVLDIGGAQGSFSRTAYALFPRAHFLIVEPLEEFRPGLEELAAQIPNGIFENVAAGKEDGTATFHVHRDRDGSSLYREAEGAGVDGVERRVPLRTVDSLVRQHNLPPPYLLKIDVQGAELDVLAGGLETLRASDYVLLEAVLFRFFIGGPLLADVTRWMSEKGLVLYDLFGLLYRPLDDALAQVDLAFVQENSIFRQQHIYATPAQRAAQDKLFETHHSQ